MRSTAEHSTTEPDITFFKSQISGYFQISTNKARSSNYYSAIKGSKGLELCYVNAHQVDVIDHKVIGTPVDEWGDIRVSDIVDVHYLDIKLGTSATVELRKKWEPVYPDYFVEAKSIIDGAPLICIEQPHVDSMEFQIEQRYSQSGAPFSGVVSFSELPF